MNKRIEAARDARQLVQHNPTAVLSTLSYKLQGFPFGSVSPIMLSSDGDILFYVSDIAQHARNLTHDNRLSVTLFEPASDGDQNTHGRVTLSGKASIVEDAEQTGLAERYFRFFPDALSYRQAHDFRFWRMPVDHIRYIGGFGEIFWLQPDEWYLDAPQWSLQDEESMIEHMNSDHSDACQLILAHQFQSSAGKVAMVSVFPDGVHFLADERRFFVPFSHLCTTSTDVRKEMVRLTQAARAA